MVPPSGMAVFVTNRQLGAVGGETPNVDQVARAPKRAANFRFQT